MKTKKSLWEQWTPKERQFAYERLLKENRSLKGAMRDLADDIINLEGRLNALEASTATADSSDD